MFGAGTVFWTWGLSNEHDSGPYGANIESTTLQQFTINMFADMGIQPGVADSVLAASGLVRATGFTDTIAATTFLADLPAALPAFQQVTITGTATDDDRNAATVDGQVAVVEVSVDGGATWRVAQGTSDWTYQRRPTTQGTYTIKSRAIDDSLNVASITTATDIVEVTAPIPPDMFSLFDPETVIAPPFNSEAGAADGLELGVRFTVDQAGEVTQLRYYRAVADASDTDVREGRLWSSAGSVLANVTFTSNPGESGWQIVNLASPNASNDRPPQSGPC